MYVIQLIGITVITIALVLILVYQKEEYIIWPYHQIIRTYWLKLFEDQNINSSLALACSILYAIAAVIFISTESILIRYLDFKGVPGNISGFCYVLFEGCIGTVCLIIYSSLGHGIFDLSLNHFLWVLLAGFFVTSGLVLQNYALSTGLAGVVLAMSNLSVAF